MLLNFSIRICVSPGEEVALYCSKYLPEIIKEQKTYKDGKLQKVTLSLSVVFLCTCLSFPNNFIFLLGLKST